jgi:hypothetical protein
MKILLSFPTILAATLLSGGLVLGADPEENTIPAGPNPERNLARLAALAGGTEALPKPDNDKDRRLSLSPGVSEVIRMQEAGLGDAVIQAYIENSTAVDHVNADDLVYLHEHKIAPANITALIKRAGELRTQKESQNRAAQAQAAAQPAPAVAPPTYAAPAQPAAPTYVQSYPAETYSTYPAYGYSSPIYVGFGYYGGYGYPYYGYGCRPYYGYGYYPGYSHCYRPYGYGGISANFVYNSGHSSGGAVYHGGGGVYRGGGGAYHGGGGVYRAGGGGGVARGGGMMASAGGRGR